jgi:hypothetical protein
LGSDFEKPNREDSPSQALDQTKFVSPAPSIVLASRPLSRRSLIDQALAEGLITPEVRNRIDAWLRVRNEVVHSSMVVSRAQALEIVNGVLALIEQMGL